MGLNARVPHLLISVDHTQIITQFVVYIYHKKDKQLLREEVSLDSA